MNKADLPLLSTANQLLAEFIPILTVSYHPVTKLVPSSYKISLLHALLYRCFQICWDWTTFHVELVKLKDVFKSNGYPENFIVLKSFWIKNIEYKKKW